MIISPKNGILVPLLPLLLIATPSWSDTLTVQNASSHDQQQPVASRHRQAVEAARSGDFQTALTLIRQAMDESGRDPAVVADYIVILAWSQEHQRAVQVFEQFERQAAIPTYVLPEVARCYRELRQYDKAVRLYERTMADRPDDRDAFTGLVLSLLDAGQLDGAREQLERRMTQEPSMARWVSLAAVTEARRGRWAESLALGQRARQLQDAGAWDQAAIDELQQVGQLAHPVAIELAQAGRHAEAVEMLATLREIGYRSEQLKIDELVVRSWGEGYEESIRQFNTIPDRMNQPPYVLRAVAHAYRAAGQLGESEKLYARLVALNPGDVDARRALLAITMEQYRFEEARQHIVALLAAEPGNVEYQLLDVELVQRSDGVGQALERWLGLTGDVAGQWDRAQARLGEMTPSFQEPEWLRVQRIVRESPLGRSLSVAEAMLCVSYARQAETSDDDVALVFQRMRPVLQTYPLALQSDLGDLLLARRRDADAEAVYRSILEQTTVDVRALAGLARLAERRGDKAEATRIVDAILAFDPGNIDMLFLKGSLLEAQEEYLKAIEVYDKILAERPDQRGAKNLKLRSLMEMGANSLAMEQMKDVSREVDPILLARAKGNAMMYRIRWEELPTMPGEREQEGRSVALVSAAASGSERAGAMTRTVHLLGEIEQDFGPGALAVGDSKRSGSLSQASKEYEHRTRQDRILALRFASRMQELVDEYEELRDRHVELAGWVHQAAGDAYLYLRQPEWALAIYDYVLNVRPKSPQARASRYHALIELGRFREAGEVLDALDQETPARIVERGVLQDNWFKAELAYSRAWWLMYQDRLAEAEVYLHEIERIGSFNTNVRHAIAHDHFWRGWPRRALQELEVVRTMTSELVPAANGYALVLNTLGRKQEARDLNEALLKEQPWNKALQRTARQFAIEEMREVEVNAAITTEHPGVQEWSVNVIGRQPLTLHHKIFAEYFHRDTSDPVGDILMKRAALGIEWAPNITYRFSAAISAEYDSGDETGVRLEGEYAPTDHWSFRGGFDSFTLGIPVRSRAAGIDGRETFGSATFRASELFSTTAGASYRDLSDGNETWSYFWNTDTALTTSAYWKTRLLTQTSASRNADTGAGYFSPGYVYDAYLVPMVEHVWFRRYERALVDRFYAGLGKRWQQASDTGTVWYLRYEQDHRFSDTWSWLFGVTYAQPRYGGNDINTLTGYTTMRARF